MPGIMQSLLLQGAVPVTMLFSIFMLQERGCEQCRTVRMVLKRKSIPFQVIPLSLPSPSSALTHFRPQEVSTLPERCTRDHCLCRVSVNGMDVDRYNMGALLDSMKLLNRHVILETSRRPWTEQIK